LTEASHVMTINQRLTNQLSIYLLVTYLAASIMNSIFAIPPLIS